MRSWQGFSGLNRGYVLELYDRYLSDPNSVDDETRALFATWTPPGDAAAAVASALPAEDVLHKAVGAVNLAQSIRQYGHLAARIDPIADAPAGDPSLLPSTHGVTDDDLRALPANLVSSPVAAGASNMLDVVRRLRDVYCSTSGHDFAHVFVPEERHWLRTAVESVGELVNRCVAG